MVTQDYSLDRGLPASPDAEKAILGAVILENTLALDVLQNIRAEHFYLDAHRRVYAAVAGLAESGSAIDTLTLANALGKTKDLESVGGVSYLSSLTDGVPRRASIEHYVRIVRDKAQARSIIHLCNGAIAQAIELSEPSNVILASIEDALLEMRSDSSDELPELKDQIRATLERMAYERTIPDGQLLGLTTCLPELDEVTTGIRPGEIWVMGAPPARAKTAYALQIARQNAKEGNPVWMASLEMKGDPVLRRCASAISEIRAAKMKDPRRMSKEEFERMGEALATMASWPLVLDDRPIKSLTQLVAKARLAVRRQGAKLIILDHLLAITEHTKGRDRRDSVNKAVNALREFAQTEDVGVLLLHHLRRPQDENDRPTESDLKESGDIEGAAHVVLLLFREVGENGEFNGNDEIKAAKIRDGGERGTFNVWFDTRTLEYKPRYQGKS